MPAVKPTFPQLRRDGHWSVRDLVAHWPFYERAGDILHDIAGNHDGTLVNGPTWGTGEMGTALEFDGVNQQVDISGTMGLGTTDVTLIAWFYAPVGGLEGMIVKVGDGNSGYGLYCKTGGPPWRSRFRGLYETVRWIDTLTNFPEARWSQAAMVIDSTGLPWMYMNGVLINSFAGAGPVQPAGNTGIGGYGQRWLVAPIGLVTAYSRALSTAEIACLKAFPTIVYEPGGMPWLGAGAAAGVTVTPSVAAITASMPGEVATGGALIAASVADVLSEAIAAQALGAAQISASVADMASSLPAGAATGGAKIAPSVLSLLAELPTETIITGAVVAVDPATAAITVLGVILRTGEVAPPLHLTNLQRQSVHIVDLRRQQLRVADLGRQNVHADLD